MRKRRLPAAGIEGYAQRAANGVIGAWPGYDMNQRTIKIIIALLALILVISLIMLAVNYRYRGGPAAPPPEEPGAVAQKVLEQAQAAALAKMQTLPSYRAALSTEAATPRPQGSIMVVKNRDFGGVAENPQDLLAALNEMAGGDKDKPAPIHLSESDLDKKITVAPPDRTGQVAGSYKVPGLGTGGEAPSGALNMIKAPVDFEVYKTSESWSAFTAAHKWHPTVAAQGGREKFSNIDFAKDSVVVLVSVSDLPNGIFKIAGVASAARNIVVQYRVDPLAISAENKDNVYNVYPAAVIPKKDLPVKLEQVP